MTCRRRRPERRPGKSLGFFWQSIRPDGALGNRGRGRNQDMTQPESDLQRVFAQALERESPAERARYLAEACGGDRALRGEVESLLAAFVKARDFLEPPVLPTESADGARLLEGPGSVIGPYKLLERIGEGGMGIVYMAEQARPVRRKVAVKIIKPGMDSRQVIARFEAERQALALMD